MNAYRMFLAVLVIAGGVWFSLRYRSIEQLKTEHQKLQQQSEEVLNVQAAIAEAKAKVKAVETNTALSRTELSELLRLRGEIGGLRRDLAQETEQLARQSRSARTPSAPVDEAAGDELIVTRQEAQLRMSDSKQMVLAMIMFAEDNESRLPGSITQASSYVNLPLKHGDFEMVSTNGLKLSSIRLPSNTILLRETEPWRGSNRRWNRIYAFADGHVEVSIQDTKDFSEWEEKRGTPENPR